jgi:hypothetical protein
MVSWSRPTPLPDLRVQGLRTKEADELTRKRTELIHQGIKWRNAYEQRGGFVYHRLTPSKSKDKALQRSEKELTRLLVQADQIALMIAQDIEVHDGQYCTASQYEAATAMTF